MNRIIKSFVFILLLMTSLIGLLMSIIPEVQKMVHGEILKVKLIEKSTSEGVSGGFEDYFEFKFLNETNSNFNDTLTSTVLMYTKGKNLSRFIKNSKLNDVVKLKTYNKNCGKIVEWNDLKVNTKRPFKVIGLLFGIFIWGSLSLFCLRTIYLTWKPE